MNTNIYKELNMIYEHKQMLAEQKAAALKEKIYTAHPDLKALQKQISMTGIHYLKQSAHPGHPGDSKARQARCAREMNALFEKKSALYRKYNLSEQLFDACYECVQCKDTGFLKEENKECSCYMRNKLNLLYQFSNFPMLKEQKFSLFDESLYSENKVPGGKQDISPRENILSVKSICEHFIAHFDSPETKHLFFSGSAGLGKTFMSGCIANVLISAGYSVLYLSASALFDIMSAHKFQQFNDKNYNDFQYRFLFACDLLIIDDLGTETPSDARYAALLNMIDSRTSSGRKMIISSNIGIKNLYEMYTERVASRIIGHFDILSFFGEDLRIKQAFRRNRPEPAGKE